ncbi:RNA polymerase sigma factor [candidate division KSB1 bacterium]
MEQSYDTQLINNFLDGDINSFNRLVTRWQGRLYRFAYRYLMNEEEAKDVVQSALIKAFKNLKKLKDPDKFASWIFQITVNLCKDTLKSSHRTRMTFENSSGNDNEHEKSFLLDEMTDGAESSERVQKSDLENIVKRTLARIPDEQRIVIIMKEYDGFKFSEIAEILNCPINTVKARMYYGLQHMYKVLKTLNIDREVLFNEM